MRKVALAIVAAGFATPVFAADLPLKAVAAPVVAYNWTGCYLGLSAGASKGHTDGFVTTSGTRLPENGAPLVVNPGINATGGFDSNLGAIGGGFVGCNYQFSNRFVVGIEGDYSLTQPLAGSKILGASTVTAMGFGNINDFWSIQMTDLATIRGRLGYLATDNLLIYATGGVAFGKFETYETITTNPSPRESWTQQQWRTGWTAGVGTEYAVANSGWSVRGEFLYTEFSRFNTFTNIPATGIPGSDTFTNMSVNFHDYTGRVGIAYKFGGPAAVVAKY